MSDNNNNRDEKLLQRVFGLENHQERKILKLADKKAEFLSVTYDSHQLEQDFHIYGKSEHGQGHNLGGKKTYVLIPKDINVTELRPDRLQWFELYTFFNTLSSIDLSLSQPFMNITWHDYEHDGDLTDLSGPNYVLAEVGTSSAKGHINEINDFNTSPYFIPQSYYSESINKFRPFLGIKSFNMEIVSPIGLIAVKTATLRLMLFDITRLKEARKFLMPGPRGPALRIEWGWQHPHGQDTFASRFINSLRDISHWRVANYNVNILQNNTAELTLELASLAAYKLKRARLVEDKEGLDKLNNEIREARKKRERILEIKKINKRISEENNTSKKRKLEAHIARLTKGAPHDSSDNITARDLRESESKILNQLDKLDIGNEENKANVVSKTQVNLATQLANFFKKVFYIEKSGRTSKSEGAFVVEEFEKFLLKEAKLTNRFTSKSYDRDIQPTYLALILMYLFGVSVSGAEGEYEDTETQLIFFDFNKHAERIGGKTIASFIIGNVGSRRSRIGFRDQIKKYILRTKIINPVVMDVFNIINQEYIRNPLNGNYDNDTSFFTEVREIERKTPGEAISKIVGYSINDKTRKKLAQQGFILPSIKILVVESTAAKPKDSKERTKTIKKVRRVFIYDEADTDDKTELEKLRDDNERLLNEGGSIADVYAKTRAVIPFVQIGTERSTLKNISFQTIDHPLMQTVFMQRLEKANDASVDKPIEGYPAEFFPMLVQADIFGFPNILFGAKLFLDSRTQTSVDNIYRIVGIKHSFEPGNLATSLDLVPDDAWLRTFKEEQ